MQRAEAWRAEANVRRRGVGSPERRGAQIPIAYAIGLPEPERRGPEVPIAYAIGLPEARDWAS